MLEVHVSERTWGFKSPLAHPTELLEVARPCVERGPDVSNRNHQAARERAITKLRGKGADPKEFSDMRAMFDSKDVDAVSLPLPNHWHALATSTSGSTSHELQIQLQFRANSKQ